MIASKKHRAIVIAEDTWITARAIAKWLQLGQEVAEVWCFTKRASLLRPSYRPIGFINPAWDTRRLLRSHDVPVNKYPSLKKWDGAIERCEQVGANTLLTLMTHQIIPRNVLNYFGDKALNLHPSLLPAYRGVVPRMGMLMDGKENEFGGISLHVLAPGIDEGPLLGQTKVRFEPNETYFDWDAKTAEAGAQLIENYGIPFLFGQGKSIPQNEENSSYRKTFPHEFAITECLTYQVASAMASTIGRSRALRCCVADSDGSEKFYRVTDLSKLANKPLEKPPCIGYGHIDFDIRDARVRATRRRIRHRLHDFSRALKAIKKVQVK